jgi:hypothetical protein
MRASLDCALASFLPMSVKSNSLCFDIMHACRQACTHTGGSGLCFLINKRRKKIGFTKSSKARRTHRRNNQKPPPAAAAKTTTPFFFFFFFFFNGAPASSSSYASLLEDNKRTHHGRCFQISSSCRQTQNISTPPKDFHFLSFFFFVLSLCQKQPPKRSFPVMGIREKQNSQEQQVYKGFSDCHGTQKHHHKNLAESDDATTTDSARDYARAKEERTQRERDKNNMVGS